MSRHSTVGETARILRDWDDVLILCHKNPDGDTLGGAAALAGVFSRLGKRSAVACHSRIPVKYDHLTLPMYDGSFAPKHIMSVDLAGENLLGDRMEQYKGKIELAIDHHATNSGYSRLLCVKGDYPAACQLIYEIIEVMGVEIDGYLADCLYTGIITDTGCFRFSNTLPSTHIVASRLMEKGAHYAELSERYFMSKSMKQVELERYALNNLEFHHDGRLALLVLDRDILDEIKPDPTDLEGMSSLAKNFEGVDVSLMLKYISSGGYKGSVRTSEAVSAVSIAKRLGGGGHIRAAGFELDSDLQTARKAVLEAREKELCGKGERE